MGTLYMMPRPAVGLRRDNIPKLIAGSELVQTKFATNTAELLDPPVSPATFGMQIADLKAKHLATKTNKAAVPAREASANVVWATVKGLCGFTLQRCYASPEQASMIIASSGFKEAGVGKREKEILALFLTTNPGEIRCEANASKLRVRRSARRGTVTSTGGTASSARRSPAPSPPSPRRGSTTTSTPVTRTLITGIAPLTYVAVQVAVKDSTGLGAWSQSVILLVTQ